MDVVGCHTLHVETRCHFDQSIVARAVQGITVIPQFDCDTITTERRDESLQFAHRCCGSVIDEGRWDGASTASRENPPCTRCDVGQIFQCADGFTLGSSELSRAEHARQTRISLRTIGQNDQMSRRLSVSEGDLRSEDGGQAEWSRSLGEADHSVQTVVIGQSEGTQSESMGFMHEILRVRGAVEKRKVRVTVQFGIGNARIHRRAYGSTREILGR